MRIAVLCALALACAQRPVARAPEAANEARVETIAARIHAAQHPWLRSPEFPQLRDELEGLYGPRHDAPLWLDGARPTPQAAAAVAALADAGAKGLDPQDYDVRLLEAKHRALAAGKRFSSDDLALFDVALSVDLVRFLSDVHYGRANPGDVDFGLDVPARGRYEIAGLIAKAEREGRVRELASEVEPDLQAYQLLLRALAAYRALAKDRAVAPVVVAPTVRPGDAFARTPELSRWLGALGDLAPGANPPGTRYEGPLVDAVERFQGRHGIDPDGVIGPATARALAVPPAARVRQIELALERYRWIPDVSERRIVLVNVPAFELLAFDRIDPPEGPALSMRVVVGRAGRTPTPVLAAVMRTVVFAPYWNVPRSITSEEMLPKLRSNLGYLAEQEMEIVSGDRVLPAAAESVAALASGEARLRQRPGEKNALGKVKFVFPNPYGVFLHGTPSQQAFRATRRDFSHGCVRAEDATALVRWVLADRPDWSPERIEAALAGTQETSVTVRSPLLVLLFYATAQVRSDGSVAFYEDVYGHDAALERTLAADVEHAPGADPLDDPLRH